jgi:hypothetical protein
MHFRHADATHAPPLDDPADPLLDEFDVAMQVPALQMPPLSVQSVQPAPPAPHKTSFESPAQHIPLESQHPTQVALQGAASSDDPEDPDELDEPVMLPELLAEPLPVPEPPLDDPSEPSLSEGTAWPTLPPSETTMIATLPPQPRPAQTTAWIASRYRLTMTRILPPTSYSADPKAPRSSPPTQIARRGMLPRGGGAR